MSARSTIAVLGPGGVGAVLAVRYGRAGHRVICLASSRSEEAIRAHGLVVQAPDGTLHHRPELAATLAEPVDVLVVATKAAALADAVERVSPQAVAGGAVVPLLNGIEHMAVLRERFGDPVLAATVGRISSHVEAPGRIVQHSVGALIALGSDRQPRAFVESVAERLRVTHVDVVIGAGEGDVLWDKLVRLAAMAAATSAAGLSIGATRAAPAWRPRLVAALGEAAAVAAAEGVAVDVAGTLAFVDGLPAESWTSTSLDVEAGRPSELDAICGSVLRAAARHGLECPTLRALLAEAEERASCLAR